jgi:Flp pilus assembly protein TadD
MTVGTAIRYLKQGDWKRAHEIVQADESTFGCWAHGIVHMMEGDIGNARYWYRRAHRSYPAGNAAAAELAVLAQAWKDRIPPKETS